jgi:hypothetical protein
MVTPKRRQRLGPGIAAPDAAPSQVGLPPDIEYEAQRGAYVPRPESPTLVENIIKGVSSGAGKLGGAVQQAYGYDPGIPRGLMGLPAEALQRIFGIRTIQQEQAPPEQRRIEARAGYEEEGAVRHAAAAAAPYETSVIPESARGYIQRADEHITGKTKAFLGNAPVALGAEVLTAIGAPYISKEIYTSEHFQQLSEETRDDLKELFRLAFTEYGGRTFWRAGSAEEIKKLWGQILDRHRDRPELEQLAVELPLEFMPIGWLNWTGKSKTLARTASLALEEGRKVVSKAWLLRDIFKEAADLGPESARVVSAGRKTASERLKALLESHGKRIDALPQNEQNAAWAAAQPEIDAAAAAIKSGKLKPSFEELRSRVTDQQLNMWKGEIDDIARRYPKHFGGYDPGNAKDALDNIIRDGMVPSQHQTELLEKFFGTGLKQLNKQERLVANMMNVGRELWDLPRAVLGSTDFSALLRQAWLLPRRKEFYGAALKSIRAFADEDYAARKASDMLKDPALPRMRKRGLFFGEIGTEKGLQQSEEIWRSNFAQKIPFVKWSARSHTTFLNDLRLTMAKNFENQMMRNAGARNMDEFDEWVRRATEGRSQEGYLQLADKDVVQTGLFSKIAKGVRGYFSEDTNLSSYLANHEERMEAFVKYVNYATGRGSLKGSGEGLLKTLTFVFWAPRLLLSKIQAPAMLLSKHSAVRKEVFRDLVGSVSLSLGALQLLKFRHDAQVNLDPESADFGKGRVGNIRVDFWGGEQQIARVIARTISSDAPSVTAFTSEEIDILQRFLRGKLHPSAGTVVDIWWPILTEELGQDFVGKNIPKTAEGVLAYVGKHFIPIWPQELKEIAGEAKTTEEAITFSVAGVFGIGTAAYAPGIRDVERARVNTMLIPETFYELMEGKRLGKPAIEIEDWLRDLINNPEELQKTFQDKFGNPDTSLLPSNVVARLDLGGSARGAIAKYNEERLAQGSEWQKHEDRQDRIDDNTNDRISNSFEVNWYSKTLRNHISSALQDRAARRGQERIRAQEDGILDFGDAETIGDRQSVFNAAIQEYYDRMYPPSTQAEKEAAGQTGAQPYASMLDSAMNYDFEKHDRILADIEEEYGKQVSYEIVPEILNYIHRNDHPVLMELREDREFLREYFEYYDVFADVNAEVVPWLPEVWREYKKIGDDRAFKENYINKTLADRAKREGGNPINYLADWELFRSSSEIGRINKFRMPFEDDTAEEIAHKKEITRVLLKWGYITHDQVPNEFKDLKLEYRKIQTKRMDTAPQRRLQSVPDVPGVEAYFGDPALERSARGAP